MRCHYFINKSGVAGAVHQQICRKSGIWAYYANILQAVKMVFIKLFLICTLKDKNVAENWTNLAESLKKMGSAEPVEPAFCNTAHVRCHMSDVICYL